MEQQQIFKKRRSSGILKKSPHRKSLADVDINAELTAVEDDTRRGLKRRVSFANTYQVKEICRINDITEKWPDSNSTVDTSNLDIQRLAVSRKNKNEIGKESINALMSAPILQNDIFTASDIALLDGPSGCSEMHASDGTSILNTPNATSSHEIGRFENNENTIPTKNCNVDKENGDDNIGHAFFENIPVVMPSFLQKHFAEQAEMQANQSVQTNFNQSVVACFQNDAEKQKTDKNSIFTSTPRPPLTLEHDDMQSNQNDGYDLENMDETRCLKTYLKPCNQQNKYFPDITSDSPEQEMKNAKKNGDLMLQTIDEDVAMEETACIKHFISQQHDTLKKKNQSEDFVHEPKLSDSTLSKSTSPNQTKLFDSDEISLTECGSVYGTWVKPFDQSPESDHLYSNKSHVAPANLLQNEERHKTLENFIPTTISSSDAVSRNINAVFQDIPMQQNEPPPNSVHRDRDCSAVNSKLNSDLQMFVPPPSEPTRRSLNNKTIVCDDDIDITCVQVNPNTSSLAKFDHNKTVSEHTAELDNSELTCCALPIFTQNKDADLVNDVPASQNSPSSEITSKKPDLSARLPWRSLEEKLGESKFVAVSSDEHSRPKMKMVKDFSQGRLNLPGLSKSLLVPNVSKTTSNKLTSLVDVKSGSASHSFSVLKPTYPTVTDFDRNSDKLDKIDQKVSINMLNLDQKSIAFTEANDVASTTISQKPLENKVIFVSSAYPSKISMTAPDQTMLLNDDIEMTCTPTLLQNNAVDQKSSISKPGKAALLDKSVLDPYDTKMEITLCNKELLGASEKQSDKGNKNLDSIEDSDEESLGSFNANLVKNIDSFSPSSGKDFLHNMTAETECKPEIIADKSTVSSRVTPTFKFAAISNAEQISNVSLPAGSMSDCTSKESAAQFNSLREPSESKRIMSGHSYTSKPLDNVSKLSTDVEILSKAKRSLLHDKSMANCPDATVIEVMPLVEELVSTDAPNTTIRVTKRSQPSLGASSFSVVSDAALLAEKLVSTKASDSTLRFDKSLVTTSFSQSNNSIPPNAHLECQSSTAIASDDDKVLISSNKLAKNLSSDELSLLSPAEPEPLSISHTNNAKDEVLVSPPLKRPSEADISLLEDPCTSKSQYSNVSKSDTSTTSMTKRMRLISDTSTTTTTNLTNSMFDQNVSENITMDEFISMYMNIRIGVGRKGSRGKRSLVFPMNPADKPSDIGGLLKAIYDQEYQLPVYQLFQQSMRDRINRFEDEANELEQKFNSSNPEIIKKIRFGEKEDSEKLVEKVDEMGKLCKKFAKLQWKLAKNKLRHSLEKSWESLMENEVNPIFEKLQRHTDTPINELIHNVQSELENARKFNEEKLANLKSIGPLAAEEQMQEYQRNKQEIKNLQEAIQKQQKEKEENEALTARYNEGMKQIWNYMDEERRREREMDEILAQERATYEERKALQKYLLWKLVENEAEHQSFSFLDESLLFTVEYSENGEISTFGLESDLQGRDELLSFLHNLILRDEDIRHLLKRNDLSVDVTKALNIVSLKVAEAIELRDDIKQLSRDVAHCTIHLEEHALFVSFYNRTPNLCNFKVRFNMYDNEAERLSSIPTSFEFVHHSASFGPFGDKQEHKDKLAEQTRLKLIKEKTQTVVRLRENHGEPEVRRALRQVKPKSSFKDNCDALLQMMNIPLEPRSVST